MLKNAFLVLVTKQQVKDNLNLLSDESHPNIEEFKATINRNNVSNQNTKKSV
jgi:hypothetical protein